MKVPGSEGMGVQLASQLAAGYMPAAGIDQAEYLQRSTS